MRLDLLQGCDFYQHLTHLYETHTDYGNTFYEILKERKSFNSKDKELTFEN